MGQPFDGVKILDLTHVLAGPFSTYQMAVLGADVIKIEPPGLGDMVRPTGGANHLRDMGLGTSYLAQNSNKQSIVLDLATCDGREAALSLATQADVIVENYRDGALDRAGLGYEAIRARNPRVIYCSVTGFGKGNARAGHGAYDNVVQASSGLMSVNGTNATRPVMIGAPLLDYGTGYATAFAIAAALLQRERDGMGQRIDVAMQDVALTLMSNAVVRHLNGDAFPPRNGNIGANAAYGCHSSADGLLMIGAYTPQQSARLWRLLGESEEARIVDAMTVDDLPGRAERQRVLLAYHLPRLSAEVWASQMQEAGVPAAPVQTLDEAVAFAERDGRPVFAEIPSDPSGSMAGMRVPLAGFSFAHGGPRLRFAPRSPGADTAEVLRRLSKDPAAAFHHEVSS